MGTDAQNETVIRELRSLGGAIDRATEEAPRDLVDTVLGTIGSKPASSARRPLAVAVAVMVVAVVGALAIPDSREAVARWFGMGGVQIDVEPDITAAGPVDINQLVGPGESIIIDVEGQAVLVSAIRARFDDGVVAKTVASSEQLVEVEVNGHPGLWIGGDSHEVQFDVPESGVEVERMAARTLLWNDGDVLYRVEGFELLEDALEFARSRR